MDDETARLRSIRVSDSAWTRWQSEAKGCGLSLTALIIARVDSVRVTSQETALVAHETTIDRLTKERDDALAIANRRTLDCQAVEDEFHAAEAERDAFRSRLSERETLLAETAERINAKDEEIASLKAALAARPVNPVVQALRFDPANRIIDPKVHHVSGPVLADTVPLVEGDAVGFNLKGQTKGKGKP